MRRTLPQLAILLLGTLSLPGWPASPRAHDFTRVTDDVVVHDGGWNYGCVWVDYDGDGWEDLFVVNNEEEENVNFLYHNNAGVFSKITQGAIVSDGSSTYGCTWGDIDNDGDPDAFITNYNENNFLYINDEAEFVRVTTGAIVNDVGSSVGCSWGDYDNDGLIDLFVCNRTMPNFLYHNEGEGEFARVTTGDIVTDNFNSGGCAWGDYDNDGDLDLFVANSGPAANNLYRNDGAGGFTKITSGAIVTDVEFSDSPSWGDYDNDGDLDLFVASGVLGTNYNYLYRNNGDGSFDRVEDSPVVQDLHWAGGSSWGDYDNDGDLDLVVGGYDGPNLLYENEGGGDFSKVLTGAIVEDGDYSKGLIWGDYDRDGDLDLFIAKNNFFGGDNVLFRNEGNANAWLRVRCRGTVSNRSGIGARLTAYAQIGGEARRQLRTVSAQTGGGNSGQNSLIAAFGLGDAVLVDSLVIAWPSGIVDRHYGLVVNQVFLAEESGLVDAGETPAPGGFALEQNHPNPFNPATRISFALPEASHAQLVIYDISGRRIRTLVDEYTEAGRQSASWDGRNDAGRAVSSGLYFYRLRADGFTRTRRMLLIK